MKRILIGFFIVMIALSGCSQASAPKEKTNQGVSPTGEADSSFKITPSLSLIQVKTALIMEGLKLNDNQQESSTYYQINNVKPAVYTINQSDQVLLIYIFRSIADRIKVCWDWDGGLALLSSSQFLQKENYFTRSYIAGNVLIIQMLDISAMKSIPEIEQFLKPLKNAVLSLNGSQEAVFVDKGTYWEASYIDDYYQHWYTDDRGLGHLEQYSNGKWTVKYIGPDPQSIHDIRYEYKTPGRGGSGDGIFEKIGEDYYLRIGNDTDNIIPDKDSIITITIQWAGKSESLNLKMLSKSSNLPLFLKAMD